MVPQVASKLLNPHRGSPTHSIPQMLASQPQSMNKEFQARFTALLLGLFTVAAAGGLKAVQDLLPIGSNLMVPEQGRASSRATNLWLSIRSRSRTRRGLFGNFIRLEYGRKPHTHWCANPWHWTRSSYSHRLIDLCTIGCA